MVNAFSVQEIAEKCGMPFQIEGDATRKISGVKLPQEAGITDLGWIKPGHPKAEENIRTSLAGALFVSQSVENIPSNAVLIKVEQPRLAFLRVVSECFVTKPKPEIHKLAAIHPEAEIGDSVYIGPFSVIGKCKIGAGTIIYGHVFLYDGVEIGENVTIHAGTIIGGDGFGYERNESGALEKFPHVGKVIIENDVEIGCNVSIDRATLGETRLCEGCKIDNHTHIAHNVRIGKHAIITANVTVAGSTSVGDETWISPSATLMNGIHIGNKVTIGLGAMVAKSVPDGETWAGFPARPLPKMS